MTEIKLNNFKLIFFFFKFFDLIKKLQLLFDFCVLIYLILKKTDRWDSIFLNYHLSEIQGALSYFKQLSEVSGALI